MIIQQIIQTIKAYDTIIIHRHVRPDPDAYGSQVGLKEIIKASFPAKHVYAVGEEDPALDYLAMMDTVTDDLYKEALVIVCDTANTERVCDQRYQTGQKLIKIDHHPNNDAYGDLLWIDTNASSTSEMIYELFLNGKEEGLKMTDAAARLIYAGIVGDTGRFLFPSTTNKTFRYAAELVDYSFDRQSLYDGAYDIKQNVARLRGYVLQNFTLSESGVSTIRLTKDVLDAHGVTPLETGQLVGALGDIEGMLAWAFFVEENDNLIRVRIRSKGPVINEVAAKYNGGGHPLASGATIYEWDEAKSVEEDLEKVSKAFMNTSE
ncbi:MAG TPA: bifunctional oligoribonuclease/PAP phosphatase NrnA [Bacillota bacterium]|nr:bifunctional oligoribonuclease/PAP phosphatase NrnA [Bacillota bacterium]